MEEQEILNKINADLDKIMDTFPEDEQSAQIARYMQDLPESHLAIYTRADKLDGFGFDYEMLQPILDKLHKIENNKNIPEKLRAEMLVNMIDNLSDEQKRELDNFNAHMCEVEVEKQVCSADLSNNSVLLEFTNEQYNYCQSKALFGMISYMLDRLDSYDVPGRESVVDFMQEVFGGSSAKYVGTIYDLYYAKNKSKHPAEIPNIDPSTFAKFGKNFMPSPEQCENFRKYMECHTEEIRTFTTAMTGNRPTQEACFRFHGVFAGPDDPKFIEYRDANIKRFNKRMSLVMCQFGNLYLMDSWRGFRDGTKLFGPKDRDADMIYANRATLNHLDYQNFKKKLANLEGRMSSEDAKRYKGEVEETKRAIKELEEKYTSDKDEVITSITKVKPKKGVSTKKYAANTTN
jgi:hypothetical protein